MQADQKGEFSQPSEAVISFRQEIVRRMGELIAHGVTFLERPLDVFDASETLKAVATDEVAGQIQEVRKERDRALELFDTEKKVYIHPSDNDKYSQRLGKLQAGARKELHRKIERGTIVYRMVLEKIWDERYNVSVRNIIGDKLANITRPYQREIAEKVLIALYPIGE